MVRLLLALCLSVNLGAQVRATFTSQGVAGLEASTGAKIKNVALLGVRVCSDFKNEIRLDSTRVYVAAAKIQTMMPAVGVRVVERSVQRNIWSRLLRWTGYLAQAMSLAGVTNSIKMSDSQLRAVSILGPALVFLASLAKDRVPDTQDLKDSIMRGELVLPAAGCYTGTAIAVYHKAFVEETFEVKIP